MKLLKFLSQTSDNEQINFVRAMKLQLVEDEPKTSHVQNVSEKFAASREMLELMKLLNKDFRTFYTGKKLRFDFSLEASKPIDGLKLNEKQKVKIKRKWLEYNSKLAILQEQFERELAELKQSSVRSESEQ